MFTTESLCVINVDGRLLPDELSAWNYHNVIFMDTCSRKTWIGRNEDFEHFPIAYLPEAKSQVMTGQDAYAFLVGLKSGLESPKLGETNIDGQFIRDSQAFGQRCPTRFAEMSRFLETLKADTRYIRSNYVDLIQKGSIENAAKLLSGFKRGQDVVIIGKTGRNHAVSQVTLDIAFATAHAGTIFYSCPHPEGLDAIDYRLKTSDVRKKIPMETQLKKIAFTDVPQIINDGCHVFIDQPMGDNSWNDSCLMGAWRNKRQEGFSMVHLRGSPSLMGDSTKAWKLAGLENYFGPEDVRTRKIQADHDNLALIAQAQQDVTKIAAARQSGLAAKAFKVCHTVQLAGHGDVCAQQSLDFN